MTNSRSFCRCMSSMFLCMVLATTIGCGSSNKTNAPMPAGVHQYTLPFQGQVFTYYVYVPPSYQSSHPLPSILLVHGGGGQGMDMVNLWLSFAQTNNIILVAPTLPLGNISETQEPVLFPLLMDTVKQSWALDASRIYVFGYSAGGYWAYDAATLTSTYFAAAGVFAAIITPDYYWIVQKAERKTPVAIYIGDHDQFFTVAQAQATRDLLVANGFPVRFTVIPNQDHNYAAVAGFVNADVWNFFSQYSLTQ